jgi:hypothetical protein
MTNKVGLTFSVADATPQFTFSIEQDIHTITLFRAITICNIENIMWNIPYI